MKKQVKSLKHKIKAVPGAVKKTAAVAIVAGILAGACATAPGAEPTALTAAVESSSCTWQVSAANWEKYQADNAVSNTAVLLNAPHSGQDLHVMVVYHDYPTNPLAISEYSNPAAMVDSAEVVLGC